MAALQLRGQIALRQRDLDSLWINAGAPFATRTMKTENSGPQNLEAGIVEVCLMPALLVRREGTGAILAEWMVIYHARVVLR